MVLSPFVSHPMSPFVFPFCWLACPPSRYLVSTSPRCLVPTCVPVLDDAFAFSMSCLSLVSQCFPLSSRMCVCVGWCVRLPDVLSLIVSPHVCLCWMACLPSQGLVSPSHPFCPIERIVSHCLPTRLPVLDGGSAFPDVLSSLFVSDCLSTCVPVMVCLPSLASPLSAIVSHCLPTCHVPVLDGVSAFPRSCLRLSPIVSPQYAFVLDGVSAFARSCLPLSSSIVPLLEWCARLFKVLSPLVPHAPHSLPLSPRMCAPMLDGVSAFRTSCFRIVSHCPHMCACVGWCVRLPEVLSPLVSLLIYPCLRLSPRVSHCLPLSPVASNCLPTCACVGWSTFPKSWFSLPSIVSLDTCDLCCVVHPLSRGLVSPLSPIVSLLVSLCWMVCPPSRCFVSSVSFVSQLVFLLVSQLVSQLVYLLVSLCGGWSDFAFFQTAYCWGRLS